MRISHKAAPPASVRIGATPVQNDNIGGRNSSIAITIMPLMMEQAAAPCALSKPRNSKPDASPIGTTIGNRDRARA